MAKPKRVGHIVLNVKDLAASTKFYTEILGFQILPPAGNGYLFDLWEDSP